MIIYIYGEDTYRSRQFLRKSIEEFKAKRDPQGLNTLIFDLAKEASDRVFGEIVAAPFLAEKRMVVLANLLSNPDKDYLEKILDMISKKKMPESNVIIFWQGDSLGKTSEAKKLNDMLKKEKYAYEFSAIPGNELPAWVVKEVKERGGAIDRLAAVNLAGAAGGDMWLASSLIDQLVALKRGGEILSSDVALFVDEKADDNIFSMVDAITAGNKKLAFKLLGDQRKIGQDENYLFAMILRQYKILLQMRDLWEYEDNLTSDEIAKRLGLHPFVAKKSLSLVRRFNMRDLKRIYDDLLMIDRRVKTGIASQDVLIDYFVGKQ